MNLEFVVTAHDHRDEGALDRRLAARPQHLEVVGELVKNGHMYCAAALLDDAQRMVGSVFICEFPSREDVDAWIRDDPYTKGNVWERVEVRACAVGPFFKRKGA